MEHRDSNAMRKRVQRVLRGMAREKTQEEKRLLREKSKRRKPSSGKRGRRGAGDDEESESFEKIRRGTDHVLGDRQERRFDIPDLFGAEEAASTVTVVAVHRGRAEVSDEEGRREVRIDHELAAAGVSVGDEGVLEGNGGDARLVAIAPRRTRLSRPDPGDPHREKVLAANVDLAVIVVAAEGGVLRAGLIDRFLIALERGGVAPVICLNKLDLLTEEARATAAESLRPYRELGHRVVMTSAETREGVESLAEVLTGTTSVFVGHSGVGKSSLLNALDPDGARSTTATRDFDGKGRHTTTSSSLRDLAGGGRIIDTPGIREFGLWSMTPEELRSGFAEFERVAAGCRFRNCAHVSEPRCAVRAAVDVGDIPEARYRTYLRILEDLSS